MKKILLIVVIFLVGCTPKEELNNEENVLENNNDINKEEIIKEEYVDSNPIKLGLYLYTGNYNNKEKLSTYETSFVNGSDIGSFEVFFTNEEIINGSSFKSLFNSYYDKYENISEYKIGYNIEFTLKDGTSNNFNLLEPNNYLYGDYFYTYLYDDIHVNEGEFYSHLESIDDDTLITSIKIYATSKINEVENIKLTVFTYDEDDFDSLGNYLGKSKYSINIINKDI